MPRRDRDSTTDDNDTRDTIPTPVWDTDIATLPAHVRALAEWLPRQNPKYRTWIRNNTVVDRGAVYFLSENHLDRYHNDNLPAGTFANPSGLTRSAPCTHVRPGCLTAPGDITNTPVEL